jgi:hypothetical protein
MGMTLLGIESLVHLFALLALGDRVAISLEDGVLCRSRILVQRDLSGLKRLLFVLFELSGSDLLCPGELAASDCNPCWALFASLCASIVTEDGAVNDSSANRCVSPAWLESFKRHGCLICLMFVSFKLLSWS